MVCLFNVAEYIKCSEFTTTQKKLLFKLRSKTIDVKANFPGISNNNLCISCKLFPETQAHLLQCAVLTNKLGYLSENAALLSEDDIYGSVDKQKLIVNVFSDILNIREKMKNEHQPSDEGPVHTVLVWIVVATPFQVFGLNIYMYEYLSPWRCFCLTFFAYVRVYLF